MGDASFDNGLAVLRTRQEEQLLSRKLSTSGGATID